MWTYQFFEGSFVFFGLELVTVTFFHWTLFRGNWILQKVLKKYTVVKLEVFHCEAHKPIMSKALTIITKERSSMVSTCWSLTPW